MQVAACYMTTWSPDYAGLTRQEFRFSSFRSRNEGPFLVVWQIQLRTGEIKGRSPDIQRLYTEAQLPRATATDFPSDETSFWAFCVRSVLGCRGRNCCASWNSEKNVILARRIFIKKYWFEIKISGRPKMRTLYLVYNF